MYRILLIFSILCLYSCGPFQKGDLVGEWEAVKVLEEGKPLQVNNSEITFTFYRNTGYTFTSTLNYKEAGFFAIKGRLLYTLDTLHTDAGEKAVEISKATRDSLIIKMKEDGKERLLVMTKKQKRPRK